jgi:hypothetical protein
MAAANYDFQIEQGADLLKPLVWNDSTGNPVILSGYTARLQVRRSVSDTNVLFEMSTANGRISIVPSQGQIVLDFKSADTTPLTWKQGKYDLELTSPTGIVTRLIQGSISISPEITHD